MHDINTLLSVYSVLDIIVLYFIHADVEMIQFPTLSRFSSSVEPTEQLCFFTQVCIFMENYALIFGHFMINR